MNRSLQGMFICATSYNDRCLTCDVARVALFDMLPDDVLLSIFDFYVHEDENRKKAIEAWHSLVHVCQRWRSLVFESPRRLNLRLVFKPRTPLRLLDVWPALPLCIHGWDRYHSGYDIIAHEYEMITALKNSDRIRQLIMVEHYTWQLGGFWAVLQVPFPELTELRLQAHWREGVPVVPDSFLGGFTPRLQDLTLKSIPFPGLPKLLLSATHLVNLHLFDIPHSGHISPKAMVTCLAMLTSLNKFTLSFDSKSSPQPHPEHESQHLSPQTRSALPALTSFRFQGDGKYLDDLAVSIDVPQVEDMRIFFPKLFDFDSPQLVKLINRTPRFEALKEARVDLTSYSFIITFSYSRGLNSRIIVKMETNDSGSEISDWPVSGLARCTSFLPLSSSVETLSICELVSSLPRDYDMANALWLELLRSFTTVKNLCLSGKCVRRIAQTLQDLDGDRVTEVLPALENVFLTYLEPLEPIPEGILQFVSARQLTSHSIEYSYGKPCYSWRRS
jgi:hypothetical protein